MSDGVVLFFGCSALTVIDCLRGVLNWGFRGFVGHKKTTRFCVVI